MKRIICTILLVAFMSMLPFTAFAFESGLANGIYNNNPVEKASYNSYAVINTRERRVLEHKNGDAKQPAGNLVKMMLLYLTYEALENKDLELSAEIRVPEEAMGIPGNTVFLDSNRDEIVTVEQVLNAVCINSANDAAYCLAVSLAASEKACVDKMNKKAEEMGLKNTHFTDCTGADKEGQYTTANDMAYLAYELLSKYPQVTDLTSQKFMWFTHSTGKEDTMVSTNNSFIRYYGKSKGLIATESEPTKYCLAAVSEISDNTVICIVLGAENDNTGLALARSVSEKSITDYKYTQLDVQGTYVRRIAVEDGEETSVKAETSESFGVFVKHDQVDKVEKTVVPKENLTAPVEKGAVVGYVVYSVDGNELGRSDIVAAEAVEEAGFFTTIIRWFLSLFGIEY